VKIVLIIVFWAAVFALFHTYVLFPAGLWLRTRGKKLSPPDNIFANLQDQVSVLIPAYNEEKIIEEKIHSIYRSDFPPENFEVLVMSDASTDKTDTIVKRMTCKYANLKFYKSDERRGKPGILNRLVSYATGNILVLTDANVIFHRDTLKKLVRHFNDPETGLVDTRLEPEGNHNKGIAYEEHQYTSREFRIKYREGILWGMIMGPSGACYAIRKSLFRPVPENFLVDDFFINMHILQSGHKAVTDPEAVVFEDVIIRFSEAFRRKVRIAAGNFQNLFFFRKMLCNIFKPAGFLFWSHKGLRWSGPLFLLIALILNIFLISCSQLYRITLGVQIFFMFLILPDIFLVKINKHVVILRFVTHFYLMNLALLIGMVKFFKGIKSNVWEPTQRNIKREQ